MKKNNKPKMMKCVDCSIPNYKQKFNFDIEKDIKPDKPKMNNIFELPNKKQAKTVKKKGAKVSKKTKINTKKKPKK
jgi:hypothetical protein|tara:strand:- start:3059 stop:3286 length:228 start_codon:yes stop_codon:yes gene_type:complete